jgi:predicted nuclease with TOPRIM domain
MDDLKESFSELSDRWVEALKENMRLRKRNKELEAALRFASGLISTMPPFDIDHPEEALEWIMKESAALGEKKDGN